MTAPQKQEVAATVAATEEKKRVSRRTGRIGLVLVMAFSVAILWLVYSPAFPGEYLGDAGNTKVTVTDSGTGVHVEISDAASGSPKVSAYEAQRSWYTLRFGTDLDRQAIVYRPGGHYELVTGCRSMEVGRASDCKSADRRIRHRVQHRDCRRSFLLGEHGAAYVCREFPDVGHAAVPRHMCLLHGPDAKREWPDSREICPPRPSLHAAADAEEAG
ncbi:hypothetical protein QZN00_13505 [Burkholderia multivorans]|nr:hypothetical protein [Burkholderia multivorans]